MPVGNPYGGVGIGAVLWVVLLNDDVFWPLLTLFFSPSGLKLRIRVMSSPNVGAFAQATSSDKIHEKERLLKK